MKYETYISHGQTISSSGTFDSPMSNKTAASESDKRWLHSRLNLEVPENSSVASTPRLRGQSFLAHVERNADNIRSMPVRTIIKDLNISLKRIQLNLSVREIVTCGEIGKTFQSKMMSSASNSSPEETVTNEIVDIDELEQLHRTTVENLHMRHSGELVSRCGDCNSSSIISPILKR